MVERIGVDAVTAGAERLAERAFESCAVRSAQLAIDQEFARRQVVAHLAFDDGDFARLDDDIVHDLALPPDGAIEVAAGTAQLFEHADFAVLSELAELSGPATPQE